MSEVCAGPGNTSWQTWVKTCIQPIEDYLPWGLFVVDGQQKILFATQHGWVLLSTDCGLKLRADEIHIERANVDRALSELVRQAARGEAGSGTKIIGVPDRRGRTRLAVRLVPFPLEKSGVALLAVMDMLGSVQIMRTKAASIFGLSEREAELAELFSQGLRVQEIAVRMGVAVNTARVHLRNVFTKTGANSQIELARIFTMLPLLAGDNRPASRTDQL